LGWRALRTYKNAWFAKFALKENILDHALYNAVARAQNGQIDVNLGGGSLKQRIAREGFGKSGGFGTLLFLRSGDRAVFAFGFASWDRCFGGNQAMDGGSI
jgi:hypothetical protein